jgi:hypothetical protein
MGYKMATAHTYYLDLIERVYAVSRARGRTRRDVALAQSLMDQFAEYAVEKDDLADYLGFADCAFAQIWEHHHFEGEWGVGARDGSANSCGVGPAWRPRPTERLRWLRGAGGRPRRSLPFGPSFSHAS